ncbi:MAG: NUDIX hydrolase [Lachnospiraceae bacterium]|jgi:ADP-ribose pyrophosphatase|nr:NUDIX hydrolase [Lachnospiraceae bacterium]
MKFEYLEKKQQGRFVTRYDLHYRTSDGLEKVYEMISRNPDMQTEEDIRNPKVDAVVLIMHDAEGEKLLIDREFRLAADTPVYNFPAGLLEPGETPAEAAARELKEETGLDLLEVRDMTGESYSAIGFSNEKNVCVIGTAGGCFEKSSSTFEEITPGWYTKEQVRELLRSSSFTARTEAYCYLWSRM